MTQPILVVLSWRGGARFERCLGSLDACIPYFSRVILSVTSAPDSEDMRAATRFQEQHPSVEVICTGEELPTMKHQRFWIEYAMRTGARPNDWICWLSYDDEMRLRGLQAITNTDKDWHLDPCCTYFGPWAMRHEGAKSLWSGDMTKPLESWTSFPLNGPTRMPALVWLARQVAQPTYIQMSGSLAPLWNHAALVTGPHPKQGPMRIELATSVQPTTRMVSELPEPITIIYGRSDSDRASYGSSARQEDVDLLRRVMRSSRVAPLAAAAEAVLALRSALALRFSSRRQDELWLVRELVEP